MAEQGTHKPLAGGSNPPSATTSTSRDALAAAFERGARSLEVADDAHIVLAVSGGADSMAMLHGAAAAVESGAVALASERRPSRSLPPPRQRGRRRFVAAAAAALRLPIDVERTDVAALATAEGRSIEDAGREARYRFLEEVAPDEAWIATAHTADDAAETVLINLLRGTGLAGVRGIPARRGRVVRPLIGERRATLRGLLDAGAIAYRDDPSNVDPGLPAQPGARRAASAARGASVPARSSRSVDSRGWPRTMTRCSTRWRTRRPRGVASRTARSTGTIRRPAPSGDACCASRSATRHPARSASRRCWTRRKGQRGGVRSSSVRDGSHRSGEQIRIELSQAATGTVWRVPVRYRWGGLFGPSAAPILARPGAYGARGRCRPQAGCRSHGGEREPR